ncbi:Mrd1p [Saccharomyces cerevisiae x Saccharomyces kudriavzevii VIN7]|uniref:Multiple RNA-binding domain-containing protein 1 n=1 Tax=Saccharomyces cerevisiae x Saccharomyces kudriavzevii (strain VIN7) TaxID=1095631 RepID=H0H2H3_SACCK|nr:Mrd1p [Saccharomyces cerevisiae x Saccharomyces kudriavzevii VIN7]
MSRIIVKGLPVYLTDDKLKEHFTKRLDQKHSHQAVSGSGLDLITDVKILRDRNGESRRFGFIGYRNEDDAFDAVDYFNGSFVNTSKIEVAMAKSFADPRVPQPMKEKRREALKRFREKEERLLQEQDQKKKKPDDNTHRSIDDQIGKNKQLQEFMETMKPSSQVTSWEKIGVDKSIENKERQETEEDSGVQGNSLLAHALALKGDDGKGEALKLDIENQSDDEYSAFNTNKDEGQGDDKEEEKMMSLSSLVSDDVNNDEAENAKRRNLAQDEQVSDLDWFKQRRIRIKESGAEVRGKPSLTAIEQNDSVDAEEEQPEPTVPQKTDEERAIEKINETGRLFLRNILYNSKEEDFKALFGPFGDLEEVHVALDTRTGQSKGFAYVLFKDPKNAVNAYVELDKQIFQGRLLHILPGEEKKSHRLDEFDLKNMPLKKQKELKRKAAASKQTFSWNSLYMNQDAVLGSVAAKLGLEKSQLIDAENSNSAVKQALAEAHVIGDVRKYFESKGVDLTKFTQLKSSNQRDDRVILVKNFPYGTTREELGEMFVPYGKLERLLMPPAGTIAIVQFRDSTSARAAFTKLSYKRFKDGIIYLEKGPKDCFSKPAESDDLIDDTSAEEQQKAVEIKPSSNDLMETNTDANEESSATHEEDIAEGPTVSIFIKNLNFSTTNQNLTDRFKAFSGFVVAQVKTKPDPKHQGKTLSMGFGFVEFRTKEQANAVISAMDGTVIDGHKIQLKLSHRQSSQNSNTKTKSNKRSGKIIVKNLPFEATRKDVFELFNSFGQLKSVRVPKKFDKSARGFAFVEFLLPKEAENAMDQLHGVHLLGRRLIMQYAEEDAVNAEEEIARMTKKVRKQVATNEMAALRNKGGRKKLDLDDEDNEGF